jgi:drug/metabolite transporter (DMT)-like permease
MHVMTSADYGLILASVLIAACGQLLLRHAMLTIRENHPETHGLELLWQAARSFEVIAGLAVFGVSALLWLVTLSKVPLSKAYPFTAIGFVAILAASSVLFDEHVGPQLWIGALVVVAGLLIVVRAAPADDDDAPAPKGAGAPISSTAPHVPRR